VNHNGTFYHLNPDLVFGVNQIVLCCVCAENLMTKDQENIAAGNDYGQLGKFETTEWYDLQCMCTSSIKQHGFANTS
jgi:hypothetical protein